MVDIVSMLFLEREIYCQDRFQKPSLQTNWIFCELSNIFEEKIA